ncbi:MAG: class I SAM-dependent methyltransferase [Actinomycetota bacterium]
MRPVPERRWDPNLYDREHAFVWELAKEILTWLDPRPGEKILDLGCGTGHLTARLARLGTRVIGVDNSAEMLASARASYPDLDLRLGDARTFEIDQPMDAVFSNATLHWVREADLVVARVFAALRPGGRFVAEFGGAGNVDGIAKAVRSVLGPTGLDWPNQYYPTSAEYADVLQSAGLTVERIELVPRPTRLDGPDGIRKWLRMFRGEMLERIPPAALEARLAAIEKAARPHLWMDGRWYADYVRLRLKAVKP